MNFRKTCKLFYQISGVKLSI